MPVCRKWGLAEKLIGVLFLAQLSLVDLVWNISPHGTSPLQQHHWQAHALDAGLYTTRVWVLGKFSLGRLRKVFTGPVDGKLNYRYVGTPTLV
jgi:hypothetical protein